MNLPHLQSAHPKRQRVLSHGALLSDSRRRLELITLMARGSLDSRRRLSLKEAADRLGMSVLEARACFARPTAWQTFIELVGTRERAHR
jgi:hypothetical protein